VTASYVLTLAVLILLAYLIGGLPFGYWFVLLTSGQDVRTMGSGNIGATNVLRTSGNKAGLIVLAMDILKGLAAVVIASLSTNGDALAMALAASAVMLGHCYPVFLKFKGGKAVACFIGAFGFIAPLALLATAAVFFLSVAASKFISVGSLIGALVYPLFFWLIYRPAEPLLYASLFASALIIYRHRGNIARLRAGTENVFSFHRKPV
jgi:glycerol-3-phosphate acyltransferase PlsY